MDQQSRFRLAKAKDCDVPALTSVYHNIASCETLQQFVAWRPGVYPIQEDVVDAIENDSMFSILDGDLLVGAVILNHHQDGCYTSVSWEYTETQPEEVLVVHTLGIDPEHQGQGYATRLMDLIRDYAESIGAKSIRLDTSVTNMPAQHIYEKVGYQRRGETVLSTKPVPVFLYEQLL